MESKAIKGYLNARVSAGLDHAGHTNRMKDEAKRQAWWWLQARGEALQRRTALVEGWCVLWTRLGYAELVRIEVPLAGRGEVTVATSASAISPGTERAQLLRLPNAAARGLRRPGYSSAGTVIAVGTGVGGIAVGDPVALTGAAHASVATVRATAAHRIPDGVDATHAALIQLGIIAGQGVRHAQIGRGDHVGVIGAGLVGALAQRLSAVAGAGRLTVVARSRRKEPVARAGGASEFLALDTDADLIAAVSADVVIEATGDPDAINVAVAAAGDGARLILLGSPRGTTTALPVAEISRKSLSLIGAHVETLTYQQQIDGIDHRRREGEAFLAALGDRRLSVGDLVATAVDPREAATFYRRMIDDRSIVGACFDWTRLPRASAVRPARMLRIPDVSGRGVEADRRPLRPAGRPRAAAPAHPDPFAGAVGRLRIGMLGCGDIAIHNAAAIAAAPNTELVACFDPVDSLADDIAASYGAESATSAEALVDRDDIDAIFLSVPHHLHAPLAILAVSAGRHVMVEKPPANDLTSALEIVSAADRAGVELSFCFPQRYQPTVLAARRYAQAGALGELVGVSAKLLLDRAPAYWVGGFSSRAVSSWRESRRRAGGGVLIMNLSHYVDLVRHLSGVDVTEVSAFSATVDRDGEVEDTVAVTMRFANGAVGSLMGSTAVRGTISTELRLWGRSGHIVVEPEGRMYSLAAIDGLRTSRWQSFGSLPDNQMRAIYVSRFASAVARGERPEISSADGLAAQAFIEAAYRSCESGLSVRPADLLQEALA